MEKIARFPGGEEGAEWRHVSGCHGFFWSRISIICKWRRLFWGTDCQRSPKSLSSAQAASLCSACIERTRNGLQGEHFVRCCHSTHILLFRGFPGVAGGRSPAVCDPNPPRPSARCRCDNFRLFLPILGYLAHPFGPPDPVA